jgi:hypothetical protein
LLGRVSDEAVPGQDFVKPLPSAREPDVATRQVLVRVPREQQASRPDGGCQTLECRVQPSQDRAPLRRAGPVVVDLAPPHLLGRYIAVLALTVTGGFAIGPAIGGAVLAYSPDAVWWGGAGVAGAIGAGFLLVGDRIPDKPSVATEPTASPGGAVPEVA